MKSFREVHEILSKFVPPPRAMRGNYTLDRMRKLMDHLGNPQNNYKVIHVAGTSGKTSTCYYVASLMQATGMKIGLTISPHIGEINERVQINLEPLEETLYYSELSEFLRAVEQTGIEPTYFELLVAFAYWEFARARVDYAVVEVGLGGLLDATNVISRADKVCIISDIGLDHTNVLGKTLPEIAAQKAGITMPNNQVIVQKQPIEIIQTIQQVVTARLGVFTIWNGEIPQNQQLKTMPLYQQRNWQLAYAAYSYVSKRDNLTHLNQQQLEHTTQTYIPARMEIVKLGEKTIIMDGAHNAQKMSALVSSIEGMFRDQKIATLFGLIQSNDYRIKSSIKQLIKITDHIIVTTFSTDQDLKRISARPEKITQMCHELGFNKVEVVKSSEKALAKLMQQPEPVLLITGSFFLISNLRSVILNSSS